VEETIMKSTRTALLAVAILLAVLMISAPAVLADDSVERTLRFSPGDRLEIDMAKGHVEIRTGGRGDLRVIVTTDADRVADVIDMSFEETGGGVRIEGRKARGERGSGGMLSRWFGSDDDSVKLVVDAPSDMNLDVRTGGGHVSVDDMRGDAVLRTGGGHVHFGRIDGRVEVTTGGGHIEGDSITGSGDISTGGGHIQIDEVGQDLDVSTGGGHITTGDVRGNLTTSSGGGHLSARHVEGDLRASTGGGSISVEGCEGAADLSSGGGSIELRDMEGFVSAETGGGDIEVSLSGRHTAGVDLDTGDGDITLYVPRGTGFDVEALARHGYVDSDMTDLRSAGVSRDRVSGRIHGGGNLLKLRSSDGDIRIRESRD